MAPSHSTPKQCEITVNQIMTLLMSFDTKVLTAYHTYLASKSAEQSIPNEHRVLYNIVTHLIALRVQVQSEKLKDRERLV